MAKIRITTQDNLSLSALWWNQSAIQSVLLLHMMPAAKESWLPLADKLVEAGFNVLAIDFRGHGESEGGDFREFSQQQHQQYYLDVLSAAALLEEKYPGGQTYFGGASIGANLALKFMADHRKAKKSFVISAGLDYYGVRAADYVKELSADQSVLFVGSYDDVRKSGGNCGEMAAQLCDLATSRKDKLLYQSGGHGTDLFEAHPELTEKIISFLKA